MKTNFITLLLAITSVITAQSNDWPVLKTYDQDHLSRIAMPVGGIGTGTISLSGYGALIDWEVMSRPAKGYAPKYNGVAVINRAPFFSICYQEEGQKAQALLMEGPVPERYDDGFYGSRAPNHGLPRFAEVSFQTAYPFGQVVLRDQEVPLDITVGAFNPLIPGNTDDSSLPMAVLSYKVKNTSDKAISISLAGNIPNFIGNDGKEGKAYKNVNTYKEENGLKGIHFTAGPEVDSASMQWGDFSLTTDGEGEISYRTSWVEGEWGNSTLEFWDDYTDDGILVERSTEQKNNMGSLALKTTLAAGEEKDIRFYITWRFPNRANWKNQGNVGNYYSSLYADSREVAQKEAKRIPELEKETKAFVDAFVQSDYPEIVKEAALFNLAHFRTQLLFKTSFGYYHGWEGIKDQDGSGSGTCTHVWNYEQTIPFLFGDVAQNMREVEFAYALDERGMMNYRIHLPLKTKGTEFALGAADGQMGCIMKYYREWQLSGDDDFLKDNWENVKKALEFCWIPNGWDPDKDGVMEGSQHNTMDVEYYGPNPQMGFWYLGALRATEEMACYLGEKEFAKTCRSLYDNGSAWMDENLFNGEYYIQEVVPPMHLDSIADGLIRVKKRLVADDPQYQLGEGCLVDQLVGQVMAHILDLGYLASEDNILKTNEAILKYNYRENLLKHPNFMRSYAYKDESALLMADYPGARPKQPFPYFTEVMTGFEHTAAVEMLYDGMEDMGLRTMQDVRDRYDGQKRNPFNEAEYGHHYARSMMAWGAVLATSGFHYSGVEKTMRFTSKPGTYFWSNGHSWGTCKVKENGAELSVLFGQLELNTFTLEGLGSKKIKGKTIAQGESISIKL